jgi:hypothetical protein
MSVKLEITLYKHLTRNDVVEFEFSNDKELESWINDRINETNEMDSVHESKWIGKFTYNNVNHTVTMDSCI